jgi:hypothetical protein
MRFYDAYNADTLRHDVIDRNTHKVVRTFDKKDGAMLWAAMLNNRGASAPFNSLSNESL